MTKKNTEILNNDNNDTSSPKNDHESKMSTAVSTVKKKVPTIGNYELGPVIGI
jgi:hypothetical protein